MDESLPGSSTDWQMPTTRDPIATLTVFFQRMHLYVDPADSVSALTTDRNTGLLELS